MNGFSGQDAQDRQLLDGVLREGLVRSVFQPVVDLGSGAVVGYEALARGPVGRLERPDLMFGAARAAGRLAELDELCRRTAMTSAIAAGIVSPLTLFVNVEPAVLESARLQELVDLAEQAPGGLQVVLEITERAIATRPAELLATVTRLRAAGWRIALDDVGADDMSLTFMPLLRPDIVKLDLSLVQKRPGPAIAEIMNAVNAYAERTGALLLAEGIEDAHHLATARALGARLGQGWMFGRPAPGLSALSTEVLELPTAPAAIPAGSPFESLPQTVELRRSSKPLLIEISKYLEREAIRFGSTCMVVAAFQHARHFTPATAHRYRDLVARVGFVAAIGQDLGPEPVHGLRGADLHPDDPVSQEWNILVLAPHFAAGLLARDLGDNGTDQERRFEFALTYDRDTVASAAQSLLSRVQPSTGRQTPVVGHAPTWVPAGAGAGAGAFADDAVQQLTATNRAEMTLRRALAATSNGVSIADVTRPDHPLVYVNTAFEKLSGQRAEDVIGRNCRLLQGPDTDPAVTTRIREAISEGREVRETILNYRGPNLVPWWNEIYLAPVFDDDGHLIQYIGIQNDVTEIIRAQEQLERERQRSAAYFADIEGLAFRDPLTGLANRRRVPELVESAVLHAQVDGTGLGLLYLDVDNFKSINDQHGHEAGDTVLRTLAHRLQTRLRRGDLIARLGGDDFLILLPGLDHHNAATEAQQIAADCLTELLASIDVIPHTPLQIRASLGTSTYPADGHTFETLINAAD